MKKKLSAAMMFMAAIALLNGCGQKSDEQKSDVQVQTQEEQVVSDNEAVTLPELSENRPMAYPPCVMIDGIVYQDTGYVSSMLGCGVMDGEITSEVDGTQLPAENDQSNFGTGYAYQRGRENYVIVMMDGEPEIFQNIEMERDGSIPPEVLHFNGEVKEIGDENLLVTYLSTADGFMELSDGDYVMSTDNLRDKVQEGDVVTIWFGGIILETAPAQLTNVYRIEKSE